MRRLAPAALLVLCGVLGTLGCGGTSGAGRALPPPSPSGGSASANGTLAGGDHTAATTPAKAKPPPQPWHEWTVGPHRAAPSDIHLQCAEHAENEQRFREALVRDGLTPVSIPYRTIDSYGGPPPLPPEHAGRLTSQGSRSLLFARDRKGLLVHIQDAPRHVRKATVEHDLCSPSWGRGTPPPLLLNIYDAPANTPQVPVAYDAIDISHRYNDCPPVP